MKISILTIILSFLLLFSYPVNSFAEDPVIQGGLVSDIKPETEIQWLWGDVVSVDIPKGEITVKYLDYDADEEKEAVINIDEKTYFDNAKSIEDIKVQDTVSVDYKTGSDGRSIAKNISVEKPETEGIASPEETINASAVAATE
jgi:hypothetical protein